MRCWIFEPMGQQSGDIKEVLRGEADNLDAILILFGWVGERRPVVGS
jgi:hypothetical protein